MRILKSQVFHVADGVAEFVNYNGIKSEDIFNIVAYGESALAHFVIYYYGDHTVKEKTKTLFGWS